MAWSDKPRKKRFFKAYESADARKKAAKDFIAQSAGTGFSLPSTSSDILTVSDGSLAPAYLRYAERQAASRRPGTAAHKLHMQERSALRRQMFATGGLGDTQFYTAPSADGGTDLFWRGYDYKGRYAKHPFRLASMAKPNARLSDFSGGSSGYLLDPNLRENVLRDRFDEFYRLVMGVAASTAPDEIEQSAIDHREQLLEAGRIVGDRTGED